MGVLARRGPCLALASCAVVAVLVVSGCSRPAVTSATTKAPAVAVPDYSLARAEAQAQLASAPFKHAHLSELDFASVPGVISRSLDASRPVLDQIEPSPDLEWPVLDARGHRIGSVSLEWDGKVWQDVSAASAPTAAYQKEQAAKSATASSALVAALGGTPEAARVITSQRRSWLVGRRGGVEAGALVSLPPLAVSTAPPLEGRVYRGVQLIRYLQVAFDE